MFFTAPEEWLGLLIAAPACVAAGVIMAKLVIDKNKTDTDIDNDCEIKAKLSALREHRESKMLSNIKLDA